MLLGKTRSHLENVINFLKSNFILQIELRKLKLVACVYDAVKTCRPAGENNYNDDDK